MENSGWDERQKGPSLAESLESPFLEEELFIQRSPQEWERPATRLEAESPFGRAFEAAQGLTSDMEMLDPEVMEWETGVGQQSGVSTVAANSIKQWPDHANRPASWQGKIYGLVVHTSGSGVPKRAEKDRVSPTKWATGYYKNSRGCHYVNGWGGMESGDLVQIANENFEAWGVGFSNPKEPNKGQRQSIEAGRFETDLPPILVNLWRKRWPSHKHSLELLPGTKTANSCYVHVECLPCVYHGQKKGLTIGAPPLQTRPKLRFTKAQHDAVAHLAVDIARRNGWPTNQKWWRSPRLLGHEDLTPISRHDKSGGWDPGYLREEPYFDWDYVYGVIESILQGTGHTPTPSGSSIGSGILSSLGNVAQGFADLITAGKERLAVSLAYRQGKTDENTLTSLVFHTRHPELGGRRIRKEEQRLAQEWLRIRDELVRPFLQSVSASEVTPELNEAWEEEIELLEPFLSEWEDEDLLADTELAYESEVDVAEHEDDIDEYESESSDSEETAESMEEEACGLEMESDAETLESFGDEELLEEWESPSPTSVVFPSGVTLPIVTGLAEGRDQEYWDPSPLFANTTRNPLLDTGPTQKKKKLSANFTAGELSTSGGHSADVARIDPRLVKALQRLREYVGKPIKIISGYRSWKRNKAIYARSKTRKNKPTLSQHCGGRAADIKIDGMNGLEIARAAIDALGPNIGVGLGKMFAHIDIRGVPNAWNYGGVSKEWVNEIIQYQKSKARAAASAEEEVAKIPAELVQFAQRVLNVAESERLQEDGKFGRLTGGAVERFRAKYSLGAGGVLDSQTELALAQRAFETLAQASMFAQLGTRDARTDEALVTFKSTRQLGNTPHLDAPTRQALREALGRVGSKSQPGGMATSVSTSPSTYAGGKLWTFPATTLSLRVAVFCPPAALSKGNVEVLVYAHGLLNPCRKPRNIPSGIITDLPFKLGDIVARSGQPTVLVVPYLDWSNPGGAAVFGKDRRKWHALGKPTHLNALIDEVLIEVGRVQAMPKPEIVNLMIAGHSRAYDFLEPLAHSHADPQMKQDNLAKLSQVWAFDTTYAGNLKNWLAWLKENSNLKVTLFYRRNSRTEAIGRKFESSQGSQLRVIDSKEGHCAVPGKRLPGLLKPPVTSPNPEIESPWSEIETQWEDWDIEAEDDDLQSGEAEASYGDFSADTDELDQTLENEWEEGEHHHINDFAALEQELLEEMELPAEPELEALAFETMGRDEEYFDEEFASSHPSTSADRPSSLLSLLMKLPGFPVLPSGFLDAVMNGTRDENHLTNLVFFHRHPELGGRKLMAGDPQSLKNEWVEIRHSIVRPALRHLQEGGNGVHITGNAGTSQATVSSSRSGPAAASVDLMEYKLSNRKIELVSYGDKKKNTAVSIEAAPAQFLPQIIRMASELAMKDKKDDLTARLDPTTWFRKFTRITFLGRKLRSGQYVHLETAQLLKSIEAEMVRKFGGDAKTVGDILLLNSDESIAGSRLVSSTATYSMHMFGLAIDVNYLGNPYIQQRAVATLNGVLQSAAKLLNKSPLVYDQDKLSKLDAVGDRFDHIQLMDSMLEKYFRLLDLPVELQRLLQTSSSDEWSGLSIASARDKIQKDLDKLSSSLVRGDTAAYRRKDYFKQHAILNFDKRFILQMEEMGMHWGGQYGDMMHFDMRKTGVGYYVNKARLQYSGQVSDLAKKLLRQKTYGIFPAPT